MNKKYLEIVILTSVRLSYECKVWALFISDTYVRTVHIIFNGHNMYQYCRILCRYLFSLECETNVSDTCHRQPNNFKVHLNHNSWMVIYFSFSYNQIMHLHNSVYAETFLLFYLRIQRKCIKSHGANEGNVRCLRVKHIFACRNPQPSMLR